MRRTARSGLLVALLVMTTAPLARAQTRTGEPLDPAITARVSAEVALGAWEPVLARDIVFATTSLFASGRLATWADDERTLGTIELDGTLRGYFGQAYDFVGRQHFGAIGGSTLSLMVGWSDRASVRVRGGPAVVVPLAMLNGARESREVLTYYGRALLGFWDPWDGFVRGPSVLARGDVDARLGAFLVGGELAAGPAFWALPDDDHDWHAELDAPSVVVHYQLAAYAGVEALDWLELGLRVQLAGWSDGGGRPNAPGRPAEAQIALVPFVRFALRPWWIELRGTMNLDDPDGIASRSVVWAGRVAVGVALGP